MPHQFSPTIEQIIREKMASVKYASEDELLLDAFESLDAEDEECAQSRKGLTPSIAVKMAFPLKTHFDNSAPSATFENQHDAPDTAGPKMQFARRSWCRNLVNRPASFYVAQAFMPGDVVPKHLVPSPVHGALRYCYRL